MLKLSRYFTWSCLITACAVGLYGQSTTPDTPAPHDDETVQMDAFEVKSQPNRGYIASESLTGSRVPTAIRDLPFVVNTITSEFMDDFAPVDVNDAMGFISTLGGFDESTGNYNLRGFNSTNMLRNGFFRPGIIERVNVDRIEVLKGPSAVMYGQTQPSGLVNVITKRAKKTPEQRATFAFGSYNTSRAEVYSTGPLAGLAKTYYRAAFAATNRNWEAPGSDMRSRTASIVLQRDFTTLGSLNFEFEHVNRTNHVPKQSAPYLRDTSGNSWSLNAGTDINGKTGTYLPANRQTDPRAGINYLGMADSLRNIDFNGPNSRNDREATTLTLTHDKRYNSVFSSRISGNWFHNTNIAFNDTAASYYDLLPLRASLSGASQTAQMAKLTPEWQDYYLNNPNGRINRGDPEFDKINEDGGGLQADLLAHYFLANRKIENRTIVTIDYSTYYRYTAKVLLQDFDPTAPSAGVARYTLDGVPFFIKNPYIDNLDYRIPNYGDTTPDGRQYYNFQPGAMKQWLKNRVDVMGTLLRQQSAFFQGRAILYGGVRFDRVSYSLRENDYDASRAPVYPAAFNGDYHYSITATSPMAGVNVKVTKPISVYTNWSKSFDPRSQTTSAYLVSLQGGPDHAAVENAVGWDYGVKCAFFEDKLQFTAGGFYIDRKNILMDDTDENGNNYKRPGGSQLVRGFEFDGSWRMTDYLTVMASYGHVDSRQVDTGADRDAAGRPPKGVAPNDASLVIKQDFSGMGLKGLSMTIGLKYTGPVATADPLVGALVQPMYYNNGSSSRLNFGDPNPNAGLTLSNDGRRDIYVGGYTLAQVGVRYRIKKGALVHTLGLNITNLFDKQYYTPSRKTGDGRSVIVSYSLQH